MEKLTQTPKYRSWDSSLDFVKKAENHPSFLQQKMRETYFQGQPEKFELPEGIETNMSGLSFREIASKYNIKEVDLHKTYTILENMAGDLGINLEYSDLSKFIEDEHYGNEVEEEDKHAETARSDGKTLLMEQRLELAEGIEGRLYDLMHVGFGHMVQWSSNSDSMILGAEEAWAIGYRNHDVSPDQVLELVKLYEFEGGVLGIQKLKEALEQTDLEDVVKVNITQFFTDLASADREFIMGHYRGSHEPLSAFWTVGNTRPDDFKFPEVDFKQRDFVELGVIRELHKK